MKLTTITTTALLLAGSLQASIVYNGTSFGLAAGPNSILQNFSSPNTSTPATTTISAANTSTGSLFSGLSLSSNTALYYDPNGGTTGACGLGKSQTGVAGDTLPALTACVGNYLVTNAAQTPQNQAGNQSSLVSSPTFLPDLDLDFNNSVFATSFLFAAPSNGPSSLTFQVQIYNAANQLIDSGSFKATLGSPSYLDINESQAFNQVDITQLVNSGTSGAGSTGYGTSGFTFNALIGDVQATTVAPEPGTIGLLGLGIAGLGYFARRRKQA